MTDYLVFDFEFDIDDSAHKRYQDVEGYVPCNRTDRSKDPCVKARWPFRKPVVGSWMLLKEDNSGMLSPEAFTSIGAPEVDEPGLIRSFFTMLASLDKNTQIVSYAGVSTDIPRLRIAAMRNGIALPKDWDQLAVAPHPAKRRHLDLMIALKGDADTIHMSEIACMLDIPVKPVGSPHKTMALIRKGKWSDVKATCEADVLTTALILVQYLQLTRRSGTLFGATDRISAYAAAMLHRPFHEDFAAYCGRKRSDARIEAADAQKQLC